MFGDLTRLYLIICAQDDFITDAQCDDGCNAPVFKDNGYTITGAALILMLAVLFLYSLALCL